MGDTYKIAVITGDDRLSELCKSEELYLGCSISVYASLKAIDDDFDIYFIDIDTVNQELSLFDASFVKMSRDKSKLKSDDDLILPLSLSEFENAVSRNRFFKSVRKDTSEDKSFILDKNSRALFWGLKSVSLSEKEAFVLEQLCSVNGETVKREVLNKELGAEKGNEADVYVCHLRNKFEKLCGNRIIKTVRLQGYRIAVSISIKTD